MQERAIHISSINRQKIGRNRPDDFLIKFNPPLQLDRNMQHELAIDRVSMTYSLTHVVNNNYNNNTIKYSKDGGTSWKNILFIDGMYSYDDLNDYINQVIAQNGDQPFDRTSIKLYFVLSSYRVVIELGNQFQIDLRNSTFGDLIGFQPKLLTQTEYSSKLPNVTNSIDISDINCDVITDSITDDYIATHLP